MKSSSSTATMQTTTTTTTTNNNKNATTPQKRKVLSGSTLNMKFMQRKKTAKSDSLSNTTNNDTNGDPNIMKSPINTNGNTATITSSHQWTTNNHNNTNNNNINKPNQSISTNSISTTTTTTSPIQITAATMSDMYGTSAQIIGRRSFHKFHSSMERTYNTALYDMKEYTKNQKVHRNKSDQELIQSYQDRFRQDGSHKKKRRNR